MGFSSGGGRLMLTSDSSSSRNKSRHADDLDRLPVCFGVNVCSWHQASQEHKGSERSEERT